MSDDEADPELLELLRQSLGISAAPSDEVTPNTNVLRDAQFVANNAIDVSIEMYATKAAAASIYRNMQERGYSPETWGQHDLHPSMKDGFTEVDMVNFVFTMDLLNFSFWSELSEHDRFQVEYDGRRWTGYKSLVACLRRALDDGIPITTPRFWRSSRCSDEVIRKVFRSATSESMPLLDKRIAILRETSAILREEYADTDADEDVDSVVEDDGESYRNNSSNSNDDKHSINIQDSQSDHAASHPADDPEVNRVDAETIEATPQEEEHGTTIIPELSTIAIAKDARDIENSVQTVETQHQADVDEAAKAHPASGSRVEADVEERTATTPPQPHDPNERTTVVLGTRVDLVETQPAPEHSPRIGGPDLTVLRLVERASHSAGKLVNLLAKDFPAFRDETRFEGKKVRFLKRAQIFVADLWAALNGAGCGEFDDIDHLTMFADYRVPQMLHSLGVIRYSPPLEYHVGALRRLEPGQSWEVQLRGCSIWAVEQIRREIQNTHPDAVVNAVLIDFYLYDLAKEREKSGIPALPHHRVRTHWY